MSLTDLLGAQQGTGRATLGRTPLFRLSLAGEPLEVVAQEMTMTMGENIHDTCDLTVTSSERTSTAGILEQPISFLYGMTPRTEVFSGYVTAVNEVQNDTGVLTWTMSVVGPTKLMQSGNPRFWTNRTIPSAVEALSYVSYLGYTGHAHTHLWPALAQTSDSDWQMAVTLAGRLGWAVFNRYGVVMLYDPLQLFVDSGSAATLISETYTLAKTGLDDERVLLDFEPTEDAESSSEQQGYKVAYFNNDQMQVALQKGDHSNYRFLNDFVIRNAAEAALYVNSKDSNSSNWSQRAKARIMGNASLFPGMCVDVMTTNTKYYPGKYNGRWLVRGVQHKMDRQSFQSNLMLARPASNTQVYNGGYVPFWQAKGRPRPTLSLSQTLTSQTPANTVGALATVNEGSWVSSWTNSTVRSVT